jgi:Zn finger protein HypA/HybF involved in hydrogenase expression
MAAECTTCGTEMIYHENHPNFNKPAYECPACHSLHVQGVDESDGDEDE